MHIPMIIAAKKAGFRKIIVPKENLAEANLVKGIQILGFESMSDVIRFLEGKSSYSAETAECSKDIFSDNRLDFSEVRGQKELIDAIVLVAAGGHNMLMIGEPGCGKTMVAQRIPTILSEMTEEECLEVTKIYSIVGLVPGNHTLIRQRPFRAPHHNASLNALIGGGTDVMPGEVSLAHNGVLFLDELAEFSRRTLDALRQPVEDKKVSISRVNGTHTYPSSFMFVAAMNPCPCGYYPGPKCRCTDYEIIKYRGKISGPIMDRIDIQKQVHPVNFFKTDAPEQIRTSEELREIVNFSKAAVGLVGAKRCTQQMKWKTEEIVLEHLKDNRTIVSGMAKGIDGYAHTACINHGGFTIAVLGNGIDICYPKEHDRLMQRIAETGLLLSEYPPGTVPKLYYFPHRKRIIAALSDHLIVIGAGKGSGALITADYAKNMGIPVEYIY